MYRHRKYIVEPSRLGGCLVGDRWDPVDADGDLPLVVLLGDAVGEKEYRVEHSAALLESVFGEFRLAARAVPGDASLLALPFPPRVAPRGTALRTVVSGSQGVGHLKRFAEALADEADVDFTTTPTALIGHGAGAFLATGLALTQPNIQALICIGGEAMEMAIGTHDRSAWEKLVGCPTLLISNDEDPQAEECRGFAERARAQGALVMEEHPAGGHDLQDYLDNGSLRDAFTFAMTYLPEV